MRKLLFYLPCYTLICLLPVLLTGCSSRCGTLHELRTAASPLDWVSAHRGLRQAGPDNSRAAIEGAQAAKLPLIELDVRRLENGSIVLLHGKTAAAGDALLTLDDALVLLKQSSTVSQLDLKGESKEFIDAVAEKIRVHGASCFVIIQCQSLECVRYLRSALPKLAVLARIHRIDDLPEALELSPDVIQLDKDALTPEIVTRLHRRKSRLLVKSLDAEGDNPATWAYLRHMGVDIILTDYPLTARQNLRIP